MALYGIVWYCMISYGIVWYCIVLYCMVLYCMVLYCIVLYCIVLYCIVLYCIVLYCIVLYCIVLYCIVLYCIVLYCIVLDWIVYVVYDGIKSDIYNVTCGVPQGSILDPLLFILNMNDICNVSELLFTILYADDTCVFLSGKDLTFFFNWR